MSNLFNLKTVTNLYKEVSSRVKRKLAKSAGTIENVKLQQRRVPSYKAPASKTWTQSMHINSKTFKLWNLLLPLLVIANASYLTNSIAGSAVTLSFFLFVPGYLLLNLIKHELDSRWGIASFSLGLSLLLLMLGGLLLNSLYLFGVSQPLTTLNIFITLNTLVLGLLMPNKNKTVRVPKVKPQLPIEKTAVFSLLSLLPFLASGGAISLNNGGPNLLTMILFGLIAVLFLWLLVRPKLKPLYPYAIITMGMSLLFTTSLRGWFITGHDVQHEFAVFQNTLKDSLWHVRVATGDPYNACLSITILPTILANITSIPAEYIFKLMYQIIFAVGLLPIYLFIKKFSSEVYALIGAFIFISFPTFLNDMSFLNRQEIAFLFFSLLLLTTFSNIAKKSKILLSIGFLVGLLLSHYSSNYITLALLTSSWFIFNLVKRIQVIKEPFEIPVLRLPIILGAFVLTFLWNYQITHSASNLESSVVQTIKDFQYKRTVEDRFLSYGLIEHSVTDLRKQFEDFAKSKNSSAQYVEPYELPVTHYGQAISQFVDVKSLNYGMHSFIAKVYQVLIILGVIVFFFRQRTSKEKKAAYYFAIIGSSLALLVVFTLLPRLANDYSIIRLIQQTLILTAFPIIIAGEFIFGFLKHYKLYAVAVLFVILFTHSSGFIPQLTGGYKPQLSLNNSGAYYNYFYTHKSDLLGTQWLSSNYDSSKDVFHDTTSDIYKTGYYRKGGLLRSDKESLKQLKTGYIFQGNLNVNKGAWRTFQVGDFTLYKDPTILEDRSLIYSNGESKVYGKKNL